MNFYFIYKVKILNAIFLKIKSEDSLHLGTIKANSIRK